MRPYAINVKTGQAFELAAQGNYVRLKTSGVVVKVECLETNESIELEQGDDAFLTGFKSLRVSHTDAADQSVVLQIGNNTRASSSKVGGSVAVSNVNGAFLHSNPNVTNAVGGVVVAAANAARRYLLIQNNHATDILRVTLDGSAPTATHGIKVKAGGYYEPPGFAPTGAVKALSGIASNTDVEVVEA